MAFFEPRYYRWGRGSAVLEERIIKNSETIKTGGFVKLSSGFVAASDATTRIWGLCVGIVKLATLNNAGPQGAGGTPLDKLSSGPDYDGTYTAGALGTQAYAATSDNQTDKKIAAQINISPDLVVSNEPDAAIGTTSGSNLAGNFTDLVSDIQVDENNNGNAFTTVAQLVIIGVDPQNSAKGLYQVMERQDMGG